MKSFLLICSLLFFVAIAPLPYGYFTMLRIVGTIGAGLIVFSEVKNGLNHWVIAFGIIAVLFNPIIPIYLNDKSIWMPIDLICGILFLVYALKIKPSKH